MNEWCWRTVTASAVGVTSRTHPVVALSVTNVVVASISVFRGNAFVRGRCTALLDASSRYRPPSVRRNVPRTSTASRSTKSVASTNTRPSVSAATAKPHSTDRAKASSTARRSAGFSLVARKA